MAKEKDDELTEAINDYEAQLSEMRLRHDSGIAELRSQFTRDIAVCENELAR